MNLCLFNLVVIFSSLLIYSCNQSSATPSTTSSLSTSLSSLPYLDSLIITKQIPKEKIRIEVSKSNYTFQLWYDSLLLKTYPCVFGLNPIDDKRMEGDRCTPEGTFKIIVKYPKHEWYKFIWFDYPNKDSWKKFKESKAKGEIPADARIGGQVGIHGVGNGDNRYDHTVDEKDNWTWGCIHLKNKDLDEVFSVVTIGAIITIRH